MRTRHIVEGWDANRYVIADWSANPVVIGDDGRIAFAFHGMGSWKYQTIADDLPSFFGLLAAWIRYFVINHDGRLFDANSDLHEETIAEVIQITTDLKGVHQNEAVNFLLGMR